MQYTLDVTGGVRLIARIGAAVVPTRARRLALESPLASKGPLVNIEPKHRDEHRRHAHRPDRPLRAGGLRGARAASVPVRGAPGRREHRPRARGLPPSSCRVRRGRGRPPRPRPTARRRRSGLAMAPRRRPGMRVAAFSETLTGTASSRANTLPPTSPAATWHGTGGAGAPRSAAWPSRSSQRGGGSTLSSGSSPSAQCHPPACSCKIGRCQRVSHSRMPNTDTPSSTNAPSPSYTTLSVAFSRPGIRPTVLRFRVNELR